MNEQTKTKQRRKENEKKEKKNTRFWSNRISVLV
jgi:hypothetical protein